MRISLLLVMATASVAAPARDAAAQAQGEIIVPIQNTFFVGTTVSVPDRGYGFMGGVGSARSERSEVFPFLAHGNSDSAASSGTTAHVWIHNLRELDDEMEARNGSGNRSAATGFQAAMSRYAGTRAGPNASNGTPRSDSRLATANERSRQASAPDADPASSKESAAADLLKRGRDAQGRGKLKVAKLYFQSAALLAPAPSAKLARDRLRSIETELAGR